MSKNHDSRGISPSAVLWIFGLSFAFCIYLALNIGELLTPTKSGVSWNLGSLLNAAISKELQWPFASWFVLIGMILVLVFGISLLVFALGSRKKDLKPEGKSVESIAGASAALAKAREIYGKETVTKDNSDSYLVVAAFVDAAKKKPLCLQREDSVWVHAPAREGKTLGVAVPLILQANGPLLTTSTKVDNFAWTAVHREKLGEVLVFDLENITGWPEKVRYTPIFGCEDETEAMDRGKAWGNAAPMDDAKNSSFFREKAGTIMGRLLHAAALDNRSMRDLVDWVYDPSDDEPIQILLQHGKSKAYVQALRSRTSSHARETSDSIESTLVTLVEPLMPEKIMRQFDFRPEEAFNIEKFLEGNNSLYMVVDGEDSKLGSLATMFADQVNRVARRKSQQYESGRLWPVFTMVLDEATNVAAFSNMSQVVSDSGGRGIQLVGISQTKVQNKERWGQDGADSIERNANLVLLLPGTDTEDLKKYAAEMGQKIESRRSVSSSKNGGSTTHSTERVDVARPEQLKQLNTGQATFAYRSSAPQVVYLDMLWQRKDFKELVAQRAEALRRCGKVFNDPEDVVEVKK